jgi:hypothetical protein
MSELLAGRSAQVQVRTILQHAWAEFEHDIRYKGTVPDEHAREFDRRFTLAAGLLGSLDASALESRMGYRYPPGAVRRLDDALLAVFGSRYLDLHGNRHRDSLLRARLDKLRPTGDAAR